MGTGLRRSSGTSEGRDPKGREREVADLLRGGRRFLVCSHVNPDGDAVGSSVAMALCLRREGKDVLVYSQDPVPALYAFLPGSEQIRNEIPPGAAFDASILLDCGSPKRVGKAFEAFPGKGRLVVIDHHPAAEPVDGLAWVQTEAAATGEILLGLITALGAGPSPAMATALYMALMTDTGSFRFSNTTARTLAAASELLAAGADHGLLVDRIYERFPPERFQLLGLALRTLAFHHDGRVGTMRVTRAMYRATGAREEDTEGFVDIPRSVAGVEVAALVRQVGPREFRVNLRSRGRLDVGRLAARFDGGGHPNAAGCTMRGGAASVQEVLLAALGEALQ